MKRKKYIKPITEIISQKEDCFIMFSTGTEDIFANEYEFEDEDDHWGSLSGWDDLSSWGTDA